MMISNNLILLLFVACLFGVTFASQVQNQQTSYLAPSSQNELNQNIHDPTSLVHIPPNDEPTVVFTRIRIPSNNQDNVPNPGNYYNLPPTPPHPVEAEETLVPTTYRPSPLSEEAIFQHIKPSQPPSPPLPPVTPRPLITLYSDPPRQFEAQHSFQTHTSGFSSLPGYLVQHVPASMQYTLQPRVVPPSSYNNYPAPNFVGVLSNAANLLKSTADKMTRLVIPSPFPVRDTESYYATPVTGYLAHSDSAPPTLPLQEEGVIATQPTLNISPYKIALKKPLFVNLQQYNPNNKIIRYTPTKYAGSMPPPGIKPAPQFYPNNNHVIPVVGRNPQIFRQNIITSLLDPNTGSSYESASIHKPIYAQPPRNLLQTTPNHYYIMGKQKAQPILTLIRSYTDSLVHAFNRLH